MSANYTQEQVDHMVEAYKARPNRDTVDMLAEDLNKSVKSIIGKLSREGVYKKTVYKTKTGEDPITKRELVETVANLLDIDSSKITGLEKAPKADLKNLLEAVEEEFEDGLER